MAGSSKSPYEKTAVGKQGNSSKARKDIRSATRSVKQWTLGQYNWTNQQMDTTLDSSIVPVAQLTILQPELAIDTARLLTNAVKELKDVLDVGGAVTSTLTGQQVALQAEKPRAFFQSSTDGHLSHLKDLYPGTVVGYYELPYLVKDVSVTVDNTGDWGDEVAGNTRLLKAVADKVPIMGTIGKGLDALSKGTSDAPHKKTYKIKDSMAGDIKFTFHLLNTTTADLIANTKLKDSLIADCHHVRLASGTLTQSPNIVSVDIPSMRVKRFATAMGITVSDVGSYRAFDLSSTPNDVLGGVNAGLGYMGANNASHFMFPDAYKIELTLKDIAGQKSLNGFYFGLGQESAGYPVGTVIDQTQTTIDLAKSLGNDAKESAVDGFTKAVDFAKDKLS